MIGLFLLSCRKGEELAVDELAQAGYAMTADGWIRACSEGDVQAVRSFIAAGIDLETRDEDGNTGAHSAAANGREDVLKLLLDRGIAVDVLGENQRTPLMAAVLADHPGMVRWLLRQGADVKLRDADEFSPLMLAVREGRASAVEELAGQSRQELDDALLLAALIGQAGVMDALTSHGASVFARIDDGRTALMLAAENGHVDAAELLVELGASRYSTSNDGRTASDYASDAGFPEVQMIIERTVREVAMRLDSEEDLVRKMTAHVDHVGGAAVTREPTVLLEGAVISNPSAGIAASSPGSAPPLVMRHYQQRELPMRIRGVDGNVAILEVSGEESREIRVAGGAVIPGTTIEVVRVGKRMEYGKLNDGEAIEIAFLEVRDSRGGHTRTWFEGQPAASHDPAALVEDAVTGRRYLAVPGQRFAADDGSEFVVSDVRPNQLIVTEAGSGVAHTLPLRGPRG
ncbi:MAG: ankyrin repeat domain-containing protein [Luteolibacter sp.]